MNEPTHDDPDQSSRKQMYDPGLANERTSFAWTRSGLSLAAIAGLTARAATEAHAYAIGYPLVIILLGGAVLTWRYGAHIYTANRKSSAAAGEVLARPTALKLLAALTTTSAAVALAITLISGSVRPTVYA